MEDKKPGYKTTEFYLCAITVIVGILMGSGAFAETSTVYNILGFVSSTLATLGYTYSRAKIKS